MSSTAILLIMITASLASTTSSTPITMGALIILQASLTAIALMGVASSWFSMALFVIYIGGLLVMFSYFVALGPNHHLFLLPTLTFSLILYLLLTTNLVFTPMNLSTIFQLSQLPSPPLIIYSPENFLILIFLVTVLFFALILVVKITNRSAGPLRPFKYV